MDHLYPTDEFAPVSGDSAPSGAYDMSEAHPRCYSPSAGYTARWKDDSDQERLCSIILADEFAQLEANDMGETHPRIYDRPAGYTARWRDGSGQVRYVESMDDRNSAVEFAHSSGGGVPLRANDMSKTHSRSCCPSGGYTARWRDDSGQEIFKIPSQDLSLSPSAALKAVTDNGRAHGVYMGTQPTSRREEGSNDISCKPSSSLISSQASGSMKRFPEDNPVFETIRSLLAPLCDGHERQRVTFMLDWDVEGFISEELDGHRELLSTLTLSGTAQNAFAATCQDYVRQFWPQFDLDGLKDLLAVGQGSNHGAEESFQIVKVEGQDDPILQASVLNSVNSPSMQATGTADSLIRFAQLLTWLAAGFRRPQFGQLSYSTPTFEKTTEGQYRIALSALEPAEVGLCWSPMFANGVIAKDFPIPKRDGEVGLEISFDLMVILGRIWYPMEYLDGLVLKGHSTILVPTSYTGNSTQWHFIHNNDWRKKISMSSIKLFCESFVVTDDFQALRTARTFVGWASDATVHAGTKTSGFKEIRDSKAPYSKLGPRLAREIPLSAGTSGLSFFNIPLGAKVVIPKSVFGPVKQEHILLEDMLLNSRDSSLLLCDVGTMRGWLVSELAILLLILHVWASRQTDSEALLERMPFTEPTSDDANASYYAIRSHRHLQLRSIEDGDIEDLMFITQAMNMFVTLQSRKEEIVTKQRINICKLIALDPSQGMGINRYRAFQTMVQGETNSFGRYMRKLALGARRAREGEQNPRPVL